MSGAIPTIPQYAFMARCTVKAQGRLYLLPGACIPLLAGSNSNMASTIVTGAFGGFPQYLFMNVRIGDELFN
jgi:hypothetical protein